MDTITIIQNWHEPDIVNIIQNVLISNEQLIDLVTLYNPSKLHQLHFLIRQSQIDVFKHTNIDYTSEYFSQFIDNMSMCIEKYTNREYHENAIKTIERDNKIEYNSNCDCAICLDFEKRTSVITLKCNHRFHWNCLQVWLLQNLICPMCKRDCI